MTEYFRLSNLEFLEALNYILKKIREESKKYGGDANMLASVMRGIQLADWIVYQWAEKQGTGIRIFPLAKIAEELEESQKQVLLDHPAFDWIRKDYPDLKKEEHVELYREKYLD